MIMFSMAEYTVIQSIHQKDDDFIGAAYSVYPLTMGYRRPTPKAFLEMRIPGAA